jgi:hypothetical protein
VKVFLHVRSLARHQRQIHNYQEQKPLLTQLQKCQRRKEALDRYYIRKKRAVRIQKEIEREQLRQEEIQDQMDFKQRKRLRIQQLKRSEAPYSMEADGFTYWAPVVSSEDD